jgi:hypothetical protein
LPHPSRPPASGKKIWGHTIPVETGHELLELAARHDILIEEDSPYRMVSPFLTHVPRLPGASLGAQNEGGLLLRERHEGDPPETGPVLSRKE